MSPGWCFRTWLLHVAKTVCQSQASVCLQQATYGGFPSRGDPKSSKSSPSRHWHRSHLKVCTRCIHVFLYGWMRTKWFVPSGKLLHNYGKSPFSMGKSTISMAIFNSYVKLPEGIWSHENSPSVTTPSDQSKIPASSLTGWKQCDKPWWQSLYSKHGDSDQPKKKLKNMCFLYIQNGCLIQKTPHQSKLPMERAQPRFARAFIDMRMQSTWFYQHQWPMGYTLW